MNAIVVSSPLPHQVASHPGARALFPPLRDPAGIEHLEEVLNLLEIVPSVADEHQETAGLGVHDWVPVKNRLYLILEGVAQFQIEGYESGISSGDILLIPGGKRFSLIPGAEGALRIQVARFFLQIRGTSIDLFELLGFPRHIRTGNDPVIRGVFEEIVVASGLRFPGWWVSVAGNLMRLLIHLFSHYGSTFRTAPDPGRLLFLHRLAPAFRRIENSLPRAAPIAELARECHMGVRQLFRLFKRLAGKPPGQYIMERRVLMACDLLAGTDRPIKEISLACGFENPADFRSAFRSKMQCSPREYRLSRGPNEN